MKYTILFLLTILMFTSCNKDETPSPITNTTTQSQYNKFRGYVDCWDYTDSTSISNYNPYKLKPQFKVEVLGTNNQIIDQTYTDSTGLFKFDSLKTGTWDFKFSRQGWNTAIIKSIHHGSGPKPTIFGMEQLLGRSIYSEIIDLKLDSVVNTYNHYFTVTINPSILDKSMDKVQISIEWDENYESGEFLSYRNNDYTFLPPNKYIIKAPAIWTSSQTRNIKINFWTSYACSYTGYGLWSELYQFEGLPQVKTFSITKP